MDVKVFSESGVLKLPGFIPRKLVASAQSWIVSELTRLKLKVGGKLQSAQIQKLPIFQQTGKLGQMVRGGPEIDQVITPELTAIVNDLAGARLLPAHPHPQILLSFPHKEEWSLNNLNWHLDLAVPEKDNLPGIQAFVLIADVLPRGGATLALAGSHKLHYVMRGQNAHGVLRQTPEFRDAPEKFLKAQSLHGVPTQIVEMAGSAGDVYLMDLRVLHAPSLNAQKNIRMMATNRFLKSGV